METVRAFDEFLLQLQLRLEQHPAERRRILEQAFQETACPYLKRKFAELPTKDLNQPDDLLGILT
ncbi:MAG: hypothetical protein AAF944_11500 [Bacteroidota bacterium]